MLRGVGWGPWAFLFAALLVGGLLLLLFVGVRALMGGIGRPTRAEPGESQWDEPRPSAPRSEARRILDERYARGELTTAEYRERIETLGEGP